jgi:two-component system sensor histidine kinase/response regulator
MTNEAILSVLNNLCNEARNSAHATFGLMELHRSVAADSTLRECLAIGRSSADRLLRSIDDLRELLSSTPAEPELPQEFDLALCLSETIELLNLASGGKASQIRLQASKEPLIVRQDRHAVEQVLTRTLDAASKLTGSGEVHVAATTGSGGKGVRFAITSPDSSVAVRMTDWLNADPEQVCFQNPAEASNGVAVMVAGKRLRSLGGTVDLVRKSGDPLHLVIHLHSQPDGAGSENCPRGRHKAQPDTLNVLLTEDSDDSYALTELLLQNENVWRARNGLEAIDIVKKRRFDVVFMDIHMPGMDGYTAIRSIRDWETQTGNARTPIVVLSSDDLETQRRSAAQSGCSGFLRKPLRNSDLLDLLERLKAARSLVS